MGILCRLHYIHTRLKEDALIFYRCIWAFSISFAPSVVGTILKGAVIFLKYHHYRSATLVVVDSIACSQLYCKLDAPFRLSTKMAVWTTPARSHFKAKYWFFKAYLVPGLHNNFYVTSKSFCLHIRGICQQSDKLPSILGHLNVNW